MINNKETSPEFLAIRNRFIESLPERINQLQKAKLDWQADNYSLQAHATFETMFHVSHQLTGTAGSVGFPVLSNMAREFNLKIRKLQEENQIKLEDDLAKILLKDLEELTIAVESCCQ